MAPAMTPTLTQADLGKLFNYDKATGTLVWKSHPSARHRNLVMVLHNRRVAARARRAREARRQ
jgi:hypothetical protein